LLDLYEALGWIGARIVDGSGSRVGTVEDVYVDHGTPEAFLIRSGRVRHRDRKVILPIGAVEARGLRLRSFALVPRVSALALRLLRP
jgi:PRC-barrel domain protein